MHFHRASQCFRLSATRFHCVNIFCIILTEHNSLVSERTTRTGPLKTPLHSPAHAGHAEKAGARQGQLGAERQDEGEGLGSVAADEGCYVRRVRRRDSFVVAGLRVIRHRGPRICPVVCVLCMQAAPGPAGHPSGVLCPSGACARCRENFRPPQAAPKNQLNW